MKRKSWISVVLMMIAVLVMSLNAQAAVKINKKKATLIKGQSVTLKISGTKDKVKWSTNKKKVATVTQKGIVKARAKGTATISAKVGKKTYKCKVRVETPKISTTKATLLVGKNLKLRVTGSTQKIKWKTNKKSIALVSQKGVVTAKKKGTAVITATIGKKKYTCKVKVEQPKLTTTSVMMKVDDTYDIDVVGTSMEIIWKSSNENVVSVFEGELYGEGPGTAIVTASVGGLTYKCAVTITNPIKNVELSDQTVTLTEGESYTLKAIYSPADTTDSTNVIWKSSNESVVKVSNGTMIAQNAGTAIVSATIGGLTSTCTVIVNEYVPTLADYYQYLKTYITKNGSTNQKGNKFIKISDVSTDSKNEFAIVYSASANTLQFIMSSTYNNTESTVSMYVDVVTNPYVDPEHIIVFNNYDMGFKATAHILASAYDGENDVYFSLLSSAGSYFTTTNIQDLSNSGVKLAFSGWNTLLQSEVGISLQDIGFTSYKK